MSKIIRWLHLSDFHIGKDGYEQDKIFKNILQHLEDETKEQELDLIFITGDIANKSIEKEYNDFIENFLEKIPNKSDNKPKIYIVPGNHDLNRTIVERVSRASSDSKFFRANEDGLKERKKHEIPAFKDFSEFIQFASISQDNWLDTKEGIFTDIVEYKDIKIGIIGTNTAWLSRDDKDKEQLSFGVDLVRNGLEKIKECDIRIVLGHHPIDWFLPHKQEVIKNIFKDFGVIYLHGHLHVTKATIWQYASSNFLNIQSGAAFQASEHKSENIKNSLLWAELDFDKKIISLQPRYWDYTQQRWEFNNDYLESDARKNSSENWWEYNLPIKKGEQKPTTQTPKSEDIPMPPDGWNIIDDDFFTQRSKTPLTDDDYIKYFDGAMPKWHSDFLKSIPKRDIVQQICDDFKSNFENEKNLFYLLNGAGGEGKTTAFMQIVFKLNKLNHWNILFQNNKNVFFPENYEFSSGKRYLLVFEDINQKAVENIKNLIKKHLNISIFISTRTSDWIHSDSSKTPWSEYIDFKEICLEGLKEDEAKEIVEFWSRYGGKGLKELYGKDSKTIVKELLKASKGNGKDTFFGAILEVRMADKLKDHIKSILERLKNINIEKSNLTLFDAFVPIVLMHSENLDFLSEIVLVQYIFNDSTKSIKSKIITPLGKEAAAVSAGSFLFTRHKKIADETKEILEKDYGIDSNKIFLELVKSAVYIWLSGEYISKDEIKLWRFEFSNHFINTNQRLAIDIAKIVLNKEGKVQNLTHLSRLYRDINELECARDLFLKFDINTIKDSSLQRGFMYEWGVIEGLAKNYALNIWLAATSISDWNYQTPPDNERCLKSLTGLSKAFEKLEHSRFKQAIIASAVLALIIEPKDEDSHLQKYKDSTISKDEALNIFTNSVNKVWEYFDKDDELLKKIPNQNEMRFNKLIDYLL